MLWYLETFQTYLLCLSTHTSLILGPVRLPRAFIKRLISPSLFVYYTGTQRCVIYAFLTSIHRCLESAILITFRVHKELFWNGISNSHQPLANCLLRLKLTWTVSLLRILKFNFSLVQKENINKLWLCFKVFL